MESLQDILAIPPVNAWLLMGDEASYPTPQDLRTQRRTWRDSIWTGPRRARPGDLLFFYLMAPRSAIHFAARAAD